ncbi:Vacuolar protein sorting-associated protein 41 [Marasmius crinis-equi]|uniref:Vacuolar protein sorting-associated protein 41 n=1 Tax=Marasmius crinis-equi TaxID=585013 RepID=A0ABR3G0X0_9AGAR
MSHLIHGNGLDDHMAQEKDGLEDRDISKEEDTQGHESRGAAAKAEEGSTELVEDKAGDPAMEEEEEEEEEEGDEGEGVDEDEDEEEDEDEGEEDEDEEDEEPALKYERITGDISDIFKKDSGAAIAMTKKYMVLGTHAGFLHLLDLSGKRIKSFKPHQASVVDISVDSTGDFIGTASMDGQVVIVSLTSKETYSFDLKRPMRTIALEPNFGKRSTRGFVCGGLAGTLVLREKGWLGHTETTLHLGEGPIWQVRWQGRLIAWANDLGVKIYDTESQSRITFIDRPTDAPRADLFKCTLYWQDDSTLLIAWADHIKVARIRARPRNVTISESANLPPLLVEITAVFQLDCMISGIIPHPNQMPSPITNHSRPASIASQSSSKNRQSITAAPSLTSFLLLAYTPPDVDFEEETQDRARQARKVADRPELRIISRAGEELAADALSVVGFEKWGCNDYVLLDVTEDNEMGIQGRSYVVLSPRDIILVRPRDRMDHVSWLVERMRYEEALEVIETIETDGQASDLVVNGITMTASGIGLRYIEHLVSEKEFIKAARLCPKVCGRDPKRWEHWIFMFAEKHQLHAIIPFVPTENPRLERVVYEMVLAHFLAHDRRTLLKTIKEWPRDIYDIGAVIIAVQSELEKSVSTISKSGDSITLMECLAELYISNRQPGKALPFFLRLRRPNVFDLIRENNLFTDVQDQVLLLVEFDHELMEKRHQARVEKSEKAEEETSEAIELLVNNVYSIPVGIFEPLRFPALTSCLKINRVVQQLKPRPQYLFLYLDALMKTDPQLIAGFPDLQDLQAYNVCQDRDLVPEMVFLLGRMGNNKKALTVIIERLGDVHRAIDFAKEQADDDLWEDLLKYSETRPTFIRGLLENVGPEINPIRLIRRIKNGLEIPGLKEALIKILQDFHLQISLLEGCQTILDGDCSDLSRKLQKDQTSGFFLNDIFEILTALTSAPGPCQSSTPHDNEHRRIAMLDDWSTVAQNDIMRVYRSKRDAARGTVQSKYNILGFISSGTYGRVYKAQSQDQEGKIHAIKKFKPDKEGDVITYTGISQSAIREIALNREMHHENVVALKEVILEEKSIYMVFDYAEHDFLQVIHHHSQTLRHPISTPVLKSLIYQLINGLIYLHSCHILHRDLKPANILITSNGVVKIGDLGLARLIYEPLQHLFAGDKVVVTIWYRAPELLLGAKHYNKAIDCWAVGCVIAELASLRPIFKGEEAKLDSKKTVPFQRDQLLRIFEVLGTPDEAGWPGIVDMPEYTSMKRLDRLHEWCQTRIRSPAGFDLLRQLFAYNPDARLTAKAALQHPWFKEDPLPTWNAFESAGAHQIPPHRRITQDDAPSMMPVPAQNNSHPHLLGGGVGGGIAGPGAPFAQAQTSKPGSSNSFGSLSGGGYPQQPGGSAGRAQAPRKKARHN